MPALIVGDKNDCKIFVWPRTEEKSCMAGPDYDTQAVRSADTILLEVSIIGKDANGCGIAGNSQWEGYTKGHRKCWSLPESAFYGGVSEILATVPPDGMAIQQELEIRQKYKLHRKHILGIFTCFCTLKREITSTGNSLLSCVKCFAKIHSMHLPPEEATVQYISEVTQDPTLRHQG